MQFNIIGFTIGVLLVIIGVAELSPAMIDWHYEHVNAVRFLECSLISIFFGGALMLAFNNYDRNLSIRQTFLLTTLCWFFLSLFASFPLYLSDLNLSFTDAFFESISGITTTGSTVLSGLDGMSRGVLFWRSLIQWIGGIGIVAFAIVILPFLRIGGMQLFKSESSDRSEKVIARSHVLVTSLVVVYTLLTAACGMAYYALGMNFYDAANHALTTIPTGGFSTHDASFGYFKQPLLQYAGAFFMFLGGVPFVLYIKFMYQGKIVFLQDEQFKAIVIMFAAFTAVLASWLWFNSEYTVEESIRYTLFNVISVVTTTGFATTDYTLWGPFAITFMFFLTYLGACTGSTAGGLKVMRVIIACKTVGKQIKSLLYPHGVFSIKYQGKIIGNALSMTVMSFLGMYVISNVVLTILLTMLGLDFETAVSGAATAIANVGPGIGGVIGPSGNFASLPDPAKWLLSLGMLLGRLEIMTVLVLLERGFWRY